MSATFPSIEVKGVCAVCLAENISEARCWKSGEDYGHLTITFRGLLACKIAITISGCGLAVTSIYRHWPSTKQQDVNAVDLRLCMTGGLQGC